MKFDPTKFRLPGCIRKLRQNRQMKYVLLAVAFSVLITGSVLTYDMLSRRYEQELRPSVGADGAMKRRDGTKTVSGKKAAAASGAGENSAGFSPESASTTDPEKQTEQASGATEQSSRNPGEESAQKPSTSHETSQQPTNSEKPNNAENSAGTAKPEPGKPNTLRRISPCLTQTAKRPVCRTNSASLSSSIFGQHGVRRADGSSRILTGSALNTETGLSL